MSSGTTDPRERGRLHGERHHAAIRANVAAFRDAAAAAGWGRDVLERAATDLHGRLPDAERAELDAIGMAAGIAPGAHRAFALTAHVVAPEECTVAAAVGSAAASGATVLFKNSDKIGAPTLVGAGYHRYKEINVVVDLTTDHDVRALGVAAAGTTGLKMGVNSAGVAVASNIARTLELRARERSLDDLRALDRGEILRRALDCGTAWEAAVWAMDAITETPMATPGNLHFAEADRMFIVEGSYDRLALENVHDRVVARANGFVLLDELNDPEDDSSPARRSRALEMLLPHAGSITSEHLRAVSADHANGPGLRSICRHADDPVDETTLSSMIVAFDPAHPMGSTAEFALGKPCWSWTSAESSLIIDVGSQNGVPEPFADGTAWVNAYRRIPRASRHPSASRARFRFQRGRVPGSLSGR